MSIHLLNTFLLLAAVALTAKWAAMKNPRWLAGLPRARMLSATALLLMIALGASGAITALGDTLFPSQTLAQGMAADLSPTRHFLIGLRIYHPVIAVGVSLYLVLFARWVVRSYSERPRVRFHAVLLVGLQCAQLLIGFINVLLLAPITVQMIHLLFADLIWINLVWMICEMFTVEAAV